MTVTPDDARMLTALAVKCRPNGASRWDSAGVMAALKQVADRSLAEVVMATIRAASDRDVDSPGVIPSAGSHWQAAAAVKTTRLDTAPPGTRCTVCGVGRHRGSEDHPFTLPKPMDPADVADRVAALKATLEPTAGPTGHRTLDDLAEANPELHANLQRVREQIPDATTREPMPEANEEVPLEV